MLPCLRLQTRRRATSEGRISFSLPTTTTTTDGRGASERARTRPSSSSSSSSSSSRAARDIDVEGGPPRSASAVASQHAPRSGWRRASERVSESVGTLASKGKAREEVKGPLSPSQLRFPFSAFSRSQRSREGEEDTLLPLLLHPCNTRRASIYQGTPSFEREKKRSQLPREKKREGFLFLRKKSDECCHRFAR